MKFARRGVSENLWRFGEEESITGSLTYDARFPGQWFQIESGLNYNWNRHCDPGTGRYVQPDPLGLAARLSDGPSVYNYARQGSLAWEDISGLQAAESEPEPPVEEQTLPPGSARPSMTFPMEAGSGDEEKAEGGTYVLRDQFGRVMRTGRTNNLCRRPDLRNYTSNQFIGLTIITSSEASSNFSTKYILPL
jgi:RHS repeat-associated protein